MAAPEGGRIAQEACERAAKGVHRAVAPTKKSRKREVRLELKLAVDAAAGAPRRRPQRARAMSWDALSLAGAHAIDNSAGIASVNPTAATYAASVAASDLAALGLPPLPASVRRIELAVECHADDAAGGVLPAWASASGVELWVDVGERATAAEVGRWLSGAGVDADSGPPTAEHAPTPRAGARAVRGGARAARRLARRLPRRAAGAGALAPARAARAGALARLAPAASTPRRPPRSAAAAAGRRGRGRPPRTSRSATLRVRRSRSAAPPPRAPRRSACSEPAATSAAPTAPTARCRASSTRRRELVVGRARRRGAARVGRASAARHR